jgi:hypothetical protein
MSKKVMETFPMIPELEQTVFCSRKRMHSSLRALRFSGTASRLQNVLFALTFGLHVEAQQD